MFRFIILTVLLTVAATEPDIFGREWYLLRYYNDNTSQKLPCPGFRFTKIDTICTCDNVAVPSVTFQVRDEPDSPPVPYFISKEEDDIADTLSKKCTCPGQTGTSIYFVFKPISDEFFFTYLSIRGLNGGLLMGKEKVSKEYLDTAVKTVDFLKNIDNFVDVCVEDGDFTSSKKKTWTSFIQTV